MSLTPAQFGTLHTLASHGPIVATEVKLQKAMDGSARTRWECHALPVATFRSLLALGLVAQSRKPLPKPVNAVGKKGHARTEVTVTITDDGRVALAAEMPK
jgi:hypothetical protein